MGRRGLLQHRERSTRCASLLYVRHEPAGTRTETWQHLLFHSWQQATIQSRRTRKHTLLGPIERKNHSRKPFVISYPPMHTHCHTQPKPTHYFSRLWLFDAKTSCPDSMSSPRTLPSQPAPDRAPSHALPRLFAFPILRSSAGPYSLLPSLTLPYPTLPFPTRLDPTQSCFSLTHPSALRAYRRAQVSPSFAFEGERPRFCVLHKKSLMTNVSQRRCEQDACRRQPLWGWAGEQKARVCGAHKVLGMENIHVKRCEALGCRKQPNFGNPADRVRRFCKDHKTEACVNVSTKPCEFPGCGAGARCGYDDQAAVFCRAHRSEGMRVVQRRVCLEPGCDKLPSYGFETDRKRLYCAQHRLSGMSSLQRKCQANGCTTEPQFNYAGIRPPKFCQVRKLKIKTKQNLTCALRVPDVDPMHFSPYFQLFTT